MEAFVAAPRVRRGIGRLQGRAPEDLRRQAASQLQDATRNRPVRQEIARRAPGKCGIGEELCEQAGARGVFLGQGLREQEERRDLPL